MTIPEGTVKQILLVEDDHGHALLITKNIRRGGILGDGRKAVDYVFKRGAHAPDERPIPPFSCLREGDWNHGNTSNSLDKKRVWQSTKKNTERCL